MQKPASTLNTPTTEFLFGAARQDSDAFNLDFGAFTEDEKDILTALYLASEPQTLYEIYLSIMALKLHRDTGFFVSNKKTEDIAEFLRDEVRKTKSILYVAPALNKKYNVKIPSYKTTKRICDDFNSAGLVGKRTDIKLRYYLPTSVRVKFHEQLLKISKMEKEELRSSLEKI